jgi:hypothetical protein
VGIYLGEVLLLFGGEMGNSDNVLEVFISQVLGVIKFLLDLVLLGFNVLLLSGLDEVLSLVNLLVVGSELSLEMVHLEISVLLDETVVSLQLDL